MTDAPLSAPAGRGQAAHEMPDPLRRDVRLLGELLGQVLSEFGGADLLGDVERLRELTIAGSPADLDKAEDVVRSFAPLRAEEVARAFTYYFHLVNLAEELHRVRVLRERAGSVSRESAADSLPAAITTLTAEVGHDEAMRRLAALEFRPVLTAHPTEARRRAVSTAIRRISQLLADRDDPRNSEVELVANTRRLLAEIDGLWRTSLVRLDKPSPLDEVRTAMAVFDETLFLTFPLVYRTLDDWLLGDRTGSAAPLAPPFVRLGSWIGADRDGNPSVTAATTRRAAGIANEHVMLALERAARRIGRTMTLDSATTHPSAQLEALWQRQRQLAEDLTADIAERSPGEPHRRVLLVVAERLAATRRRDADLGYPDAAACMADLRTVQESLLAAGAARAAYADLQTLMWQLQTFGFHLAELEVRQHSKVHAETLAAIKSGGDLDERSAEVLETFRAIAAVQRRYGEPACRRYIVSFTQRAADIGSVYELAEIALGSPDAAPTLDVIPLFETFADLEACVGILEEVVQHPRVQQRLATTGRRMEVMLGYSDSAKDVGPTSATLALYDAQARIATWARENDITLTLFHGRGGALGRGGGPANRAVLAQPPGSVDGRFKLTEQGEVIFARYGDPAIAERHIEQVASATLLHSAPSTERRNAEAARKFAGVAGVLDESSRRRYHELVLSEGFAPWFGLVTPQEEIGLLALGSRPARRGLSLESLEDLRAIPWVFAWTQARINLTGWFGLGTAMEAVGDVDLLRSAYTEWPLFSTMLDNVEMSLAKTDERIARAYLDLGDREDLSDLILGEMELTSRWVLSVTGQSRLLANRRVLGRAVQLRNPYVDALSLLQLRALRGLRSGDDAHTAEHQRLLLLTVNGVAAGLQNTG
jgi:phosphoenolpyruvate carboxylase